MVCEYKNFLLKLTLFLIYLVQGFFSIKFPLTGQEKAVI